MRRIDDICQRTKINLMCPLREDKKLLVLDLDYTLVDFSVKDGDFERRKRPFCDEMLTELYKYYDIVIWSQTSWKWLELKLTEFGFLSHPNYSIAFVLDASSMPVVTTLNRRGQKRKHAIKPLSIIWKLFPRFSASNTLHVDDLQRNFVLNPENGLLVTPFKVQNRDGDRELEELTEYLKCLAQECEDVRERNLGAWREG